MRLLVTRLFVSTVERLGERLLSRADLLCHVLDRTQTEARVEFPDERSAFVRTLTSGRRTLRKHLDYIAIAVRVQCDWQPSVILASMSKRRVIFIEDVKSLERSVNVCLQVYFLENSPASHVYVALTRRAQNRTRRGGARELPALASLRHAACIRDQELYEEPLLPVGSSPSHIVYALLCLISIFLYVVQKMKQITTMFRFSTAAVATARPTIRTTHVHPFVSPRLRPLAYSTSTTTSHRKRPSAIAQRLPDPDEVHGPHRFREFEVRKWTSRSY
jgi:hypothetical protein